jgi:pyruvate, water dikinase
VVGCVIRGRAVHPWTIAIGYLLHNPMTAGIAILLGSVAMTFFRQERQSTIVMIVVFPLVTVLLRGYQQPLVVMTGLLSALLYFTIARKSAQKSMSRSTPKAIPSNTELKFFRADAGIAKLGDRLIANRVGQPAALMSELVRDGYSIPETWVILPGDDLEPMISVLQPSRQNPAVVRYSKLPSPRKASTSVGSLSSNPESPDRWEAHNANDFRGTIVHVFDRSRDPVVLMVQSKIWEVFSGSVQQVMPGYFLVTIGDLRFEVRSSGEVSGAGNVPIRLVTEVAELFQRLQKDYERQISQQFAGSIVLDWMHDGDTLWIDTIR